MHEKNEIEKELFIRYGTAASEVMFDFPSYFFKIPDTKGMISYRIENKCVVVFGDPMCPKEEREKLTRAFHQFCAEKNLNILYIIVSESFTKWALEEKLCRISIKVCDEFIFDPYADPCEESHRLSHRVEKATKHGLTFHEYTPVDSKIEDTLKSIGMEWQKKIKGSHIFLGHLNFFESYEGKRWFYVKDGDQITGMIMLSKIQSQNGWFLKFLITSADAFPDTSEFLMTSLLKTLRNEKCHFLTKGMMPSSSLENITGLNDALIFIAHQSYKAIRWMFKFDKRKEYWLRYHPKIQPSYLLIARDHMGYSEIRALMKAFKISKTSLKKYMPTFLLSLFNKRK